MNEEEIQRKYLELQLIEKQIKQIQQQMQFMEQQLLELTSLSNSVEEITKVKPKTEILVPLGAGVYAKAELKDNKDFIMNVGADVTTTKSAKESISIIENQIAQLKALLEQLSAELENAAMAGHKLQGELQEAVNSSKSHAGHPHP